MARCLPAYLVALCLGAPALAADAPLPPLQVNTRAVPPQVKLGEPFELEVVITHVKDQRYDVRPVVGVDAFDVGEGRRERVDGADRATTTFRIQMSAFELGKHKTPAVSFEVWSGPTQGTFEVPGVEVEVVSTLPPDADKTGAGLHDVVGPVDVAVRTWRLVYALLGLLALGLALWQLNRFLKRPRPAQATPAAPAEPLEVRVRKQLDALRGEDLPGQGRVKEYYFRLSEIVRTYLGERYDFDALESTSPELLDSLRRLHTPGLPLRELQDFVNESDFVRYAKGSADPMACKGAIELAYTIVQATSAPKPPAAHAPQLRVS